VIGRIDVSPNIAPSHSGLITLGSSIQAISCGAYHPAALKGLNWLRREVGMISPLGLCREGLGPKGWIRLAMKKSFKP